MDYKEKLKKVEYSLGNLLAAVDNLGKAADYKASYYKELGELTKTNFEDGAALAYWVAFSLIVDFRDKYFSTDEENDEE